MATVIDGKGNEYLFTFTQPEKGWIRYLASTMGITKEAVVGAAMNKGLTHYVEVFRSIEEAGSPPSHAEGKDTPDTGG